MEFEFASMLINFGVLGVWTAYLLYEKKILMTKITESLDKLSDAINNHDRRFR